MSAYSSWKSIVCWALSPSYGAFTLDVMSVLNENLGGILGGTYCSMDDTLMLGEC
jgi:hypothetical protein